MKQGTSEKMIPVQFPSDRGEDGRWSEARDQTVYKIPLSQLDRAQKEYGATIYRPGLGRGQSAAARIADLLPLAGGITGEAVGTVGGAIGGAGAASVPLAVGGKMLGGGLGSGAGQALREGIYRAAGLGDAPGTVLGEAGMGAAGSLVGQGAAKAAKFGGKALLTSSIGQRGLARGSKVLDDMISSNTPVGKIFRSGSERARAIVRATGERIDKMVNRTPASRTMSQRQMRAPGTDLIRNAEKYGEETDLALLRRLRERVTTSIDPRTGLRVTRKTPATADEVRALRQKYDNKLSAYWESTNTPAGRRTRASLPEREKFYYDTANNLRAWLSKNVPPVKVVPKRTVTQKLQEAVLGKKPVARKMTFDQANELAKRAIAMEQAIRIGEKTSGLAKLGTGGAATLATTGVGLGAGLGALTGSATPMATGGAAGLLLQMSPALASRLGIALARPSGQAVAGASGQLLRPMLGTPYTNEFGIPSATGMAPQQDSTQGEQQ